MKYDTTCHVLAGRETEMSNSGFDESSELALSNVPYSVLLQDGFELSQSQMLAWCPLSNKGTQQ